jgi:DNA polymerase-3 subunit epsilon
MNTTPWILLDTETTGFTAPVSVIELAAQRMRGWEPDGQPFRKLLNQNQDIPAEASRLHGYTREILERDGESPLAVYRAFAEYAGTLPLVSFDLEHDLDEVFKPEWKRLHLAPIGSQGFCAMRLARRLLDPVPAGDCKLQTLRLYYGLSEHDDHTALGQLQTVLDLLAKVIRPIAEHRGLDSWEKLVKYASEEWYPSRIPFGKHKGRLALEAQQDTDLRGWIDWLAASSNARSASMGQWYLHQLNLKPKPRVDTTVFAECAVQGKAEPRRTALEAGLAAVAIYVNPKLEKLRQLVAGARARLAELEATYTREKARVDAMQAILFRRLHEYYQKRDRLRLIVDYRTKFLNALIRGGEAEAKETQANYEKARAQADKDYEETAAAVANKKQLTPEQEAELIKLWKKLVKLYHPDRFAHEPEKLATYEKLTAAINRAKDSGDIDTLRQIAEDPLGFILRQGWESLDFSDEAELTQLRRLLETLQLEIINVLDSLNRLRESPDFELCRLSEKKPGMLDDLAAERAKLLTKESSDLEIQANRLAEEIEELSGAGPSHIG